MTYPVQRFLEVLSLIAPKHVFTYLHQLNRSYYSLQHSLLFHVQIKIHTNHFDKSIVIDSFLLV